MPGFLNSDGSELVGGKLPAGSGQSLNLDALGNLLVNIAAWAANQSVNLAQLNGSSLQMSQDDGATLNSLLELAPMGYNSGGPTLANGVPSQLTFDRLRTWLGKGLQASTVNATNAGDTSLTFSSAPKTILPGQSIKLIGGSNAEYVYVTDTFTPGPAVTSIPLKNAVVNAGQNLASWSVFNVAGPSIGAVPVDGILMVQETLLDVTTSNLYAKQGFRGVQDVNTGGRSSLAIAASTAGNTVVKNGPGRLARILVTTAGTNPLNVFDNASAPSGTQIALVPASAAAGTMIDCQTPALNGITVQGNASNPGVTIFLY